ncbi:MAG: hypothetical protein GEU93_18525 [Propionibacteriales bacterium]|nr:hypothetical protein [Propionibacteriales bacterium]
MGWAGELRPSVSRRTPVVRIEDGEAGLSARTIKRRLATIAGLYDRLSQLEMPRLVESAAATSSGCGLRRRAQDGDYRAHANHAYPLSPKEETHGLWSIIRW